MKYIVSLIFVVSSLGVFAQREAEAKIDQVEIKVSSICGECKERIEKELNYTKGVVFSEVDLDKGIVLVKFKTKVLTLDQIRNIIVNLGYSADGIPANQEAFKALPKCCQAEGCGK